jgi:membrane protein DedA with SNARE-associated domain
LRSILELVNHYDYIILFIALSLKLIAFPLPAELIMTYCGFLVYEAKMNWLLSILVATVGSALGITISYFLGGILGTGFFKKYGSYVHLGPEKLEKTSQWFKSYGNKLLIISYFIPIVCHITGYFSGIMEIPFKKFALNAYLGALLWTSTFVSLGKFLGPNWDRFHGSVKKYLIISSLAVGVILVFIYFYRSQRTEITEFTYKMLNRTMKVFHSMGRIRIAIAATAAAFLSFSILLIGVIQDYSAHEFSKFDTIVSYLVKSIFTKDWAHLIEQFSILTSLKLFVPLTILIIIWILRINKNRILEIQFLFITIGGAEVLQFILRNAFRRLGPSSINLIENIQYTFPSNQSLMAIAVYGFFAFIIIRHTKKAWISTTLVVSALFICILACLNPLFFQTEYPSDLYAGFIFGGVWLTINIILLEVYRILPKVQF